MAVAERVAKRNGPRTSFAFERELWARAVQDARRLGVSNTAWLEQAIRMQLDAREGGDDAPPVPDPSLSQAAAIEHHGPPLRCPVPGCGDLPAGVRDCALHKRRGIASA